MHSRLAAAIVAALAAAASAPAQTPAPAAPAAPTAPAATSRFELGRYYAGPRVWIGNLNGALAVGGQVERGLTPPGRYGPGIVGVGVGVDYYRWSQRYGVPGFSGEWKYSVVPVQVFGNYHFVLDDFRKLDPYLGVALVYSHYSASWSGTGTVPAGASASTTAFAGQGGVRYFVSDALAVQGQLGFGYGTLGLGATWRF